jgi:hypothetical protein
MAFDSDDDADGHSENQALKKVVFVHGSISDRAGLTVKQSGRS